MKSPFNPFQAATGGNKGCFYLHMGYDVPRWRCYCSCIAKWAGHAAGVEQTEGRRASPWAAEAGKAMQYAAPLLPFFKRVLQNQMSAKNCCEPIQGLEEISHGESLREVVYSFCQQRA